MFTSTHLYNFSIPFVQTKTWNLLYSDNIFNAAGVAYEANREEDLDLPPTSLSNELEEEPSTPEKKVHIASTANEFRTPQKEEDLANETESFAVSPMPEEWRTPLENITNASSSASKDWRVSSGEKSETLRQPRKLKRLRRLGDCSSAVKENNPGIAKTDHIRSRSRSVKNIRGKMILYFLVQIT